MAAQQPGGVERPHYVGRYPRNSIDSRSDAKLGLARDFLIDRSNPYVEVAFSFGKFAVSLLGLGRARAQRAIAAMAVNRAHEVLAAGNFLPVQSAAKCLALGLKFEQMFVKLRSIDCDSALLSGEFFQLQGTFLSILPR